MARLKFSKHANECKSKSIKECKRALLRKNCKQPGLKQPGLGTPKGYPGVLPGYPGGTRKIRENKVCVHFLAPKFQTLRIAQTMKHFSTSESQVQSRAHHVRRPSLLTPLPPSRNGSPTPTQPSPSSSSKSGKGGGKLRGGETYHKAPPQERLWIPPPIREKLKGDN